MTFGHDAGLLPFQIDLPTDRVLLLRLSEQDYRGASFLDNRVLDQQRPMQWAGWRELEAQSAGLGGDSAWIFHIGHVGSTLLSRLLGETPGVLALREPQILRQLAELGALRGKPHAPWPPEDFDRRLELVVRWLSRGFAPGQRSLVKATSFASPLARAVLGDSRRALFLHVGPETYLRTILAGENSRRELAMLAAPRLERLHALIGAEPFRLWQLDEAQRAAVSWACEMATLEAASNERVEWVDFDAFLAQPAVGLRRSADHLGVTMTQAEAEGLVAGPIMQQYSKAPEHAYTPQLRSEVLAQAAGAHAGAIAGAMRWLEAAGRDHAAIAGALERSARG